MISGFALNATKLLIRVLFADKEIHVKYQKPQECCQELRKARRLCVYVIVGGVIVVILSLKVPALWAFLNSTAAWIVEGIVIAFVAIVALRAIIVSR